MHTGPAVDIPELIDRARTAPAPQTYRDEPWFSLWSALCHQGDVFTASYAAVPALVGIAADRAGEPQVLGECLFLVATIELERAAPESSRPVPALPAEIADSYRLALSRAAAMVEHAPTSVDSEMIAICRAVFGGDLRTARELTNGSDDHGE